MTAVLRIISGLEMGGAERNLVQVAAGYNLAVFPSMWTASGQVRISPQRCIPLPRRQTARYAHRCFLTPAGLRRSRGHLPL